MARPLRAARCPGSLFALLGAARARLARPDRLRLDRLRGRGRARLRRARRTATSRCFLQLCPAYGGSLIMRAPFALAAHGPGRRRRRGLPRRRRARACWPAPRSASCSPRACSRAAPAAARSRSSSALCAANPITLRALDIGHPEELLGAALSAGAVLAALRGRPTLGRRAARARGRQQGVGAARGRARCCSRCRQRRGGRS